MFVPFAGERGLGRIFRDSACRRPSTKSTDGKSRRLAILPDAGYDKEAGSFLLSVYHEGLRCLNAKIFPFHRDTACGMIGMEICFMKIGASTSNLYPMQTEDALGALLSLGFRTLEVFVNTESETSPAFANELRRRAQAEGGEILSFHSYTAGTDPYLLFSAYRRRFEDGKEHYRRLFEAAALCGARYLVIHGDKEGGVLPEEEVFARYEELYDLGQKAGVTLLQENVVHFRSADPGFLRRMRAALGEKARFVFDVKQCARCKLEPEAVLDAMGDALRHVHISDQSADRDCLIPGRGNNDYRSLRGRMASCGFDGVWILELYRDNFRDLSDLEEGRRYLERLLNN